MTPDPVDPLPLCRHCEEPLTEKVGFWTHFHGLYRCQQKVSYGHNAAHPDVPCLPGGGNPCKCTYPPDVTPGACTCRCRLGGGHEPSCPARRVAT